MKLNATTEMTPVTWPEFGSLHPYAPIDQAGGYLSLFADLEAVAGRGHRIRRGVVAAERGSQGRVRGLLAIRAYHEARGEIVRNGLPHPGERARHQRGERGDGRHARSSW
jgi:glycine dehydrogenase